MRKYTKFQKVICLFKYKITTQKIYKIELITNDLLYSLKYPNATRPQLPSINVTDISGVSKLSHFSVVIYPKSSCPPNNDNN